MPMWGYYATGGMGWWMILSSLFWLILAAVLVWAVVRWQSSASRSTTQDGPHEPAQLSAMDILKASYARGEIDAATFQMMRAQVEEPSVAPPRTPQEPIPSGR
jgi:putative membrane protein